MPDCSPIEGKICSAESDQAVNPSMLRTTPGENRRKTTISSSTVISRLADSAKFSAQPGPALKQTQIARLPSTAQNDIPSQTGKLSFLRAPEHADQREHHPQHRESSKQRGTVGEMP